MRLSIALCLALFGCAAPISDQANIVIVTTQQLVVERKKPILFVVHDKEGDWEFLANNKGLDPAIRIAWNDMIAIDSTLAPVLTMKPGWFAWRSSVSEPWAIEVYKP